MRRYLQRTFVWAVSIFVIILTAGCEEQDLSNTKKHRLIAVENTQLKAENDQLKKDLELRNKKVEEQKKLLEEYRQEKMTLKADALKGFQGKIDNVLTESAKNNMKLRLENQELKEQIEQLKARVQRLEKELQQIKKPEPEPLPSTP